MPWLAATDEAERLVAERAVELAVALLPSEHERAARSWTRTEAVVGLNAALEGEPLIALDVGG